jgi:thiamine pyridinylase
MRRSLALIVLGLLLSACGCGSHATEIGPTQPRAPGPEHDPSAPIATLRVGLVPLVPRLDRFQRVIGEAWHELQPRVALDFVSRDGGRAQDPLALKLDVFVFDAAFLDDLRAKGRLRPLQSAELAPLSDFVPYATRGLLLDPAYSPASRCSAARPAVALRLAVLIVGR